MARLHSLHNSGDQRRTATNFCCSFGCEGSEIQGFCREQGATWPKISCENSKNSRVRSSPHPARVSGEDSPSSIRDTRRDANGGRSPSRNGANMDDDGDTTRRAVHPSNAKSIRSTSTVLPQVGRRQPSRSPRRQGLPGRISSSFYLLVVITDLNNEKASRITPVNYKFFIWARVG